MLAATPGQGCRRVPGCGCGWATDGGAAASQSGREGMGSGRGAAAGTPSAHGGESRCAPAGVAGCGCYAGAAGCGCARGGGTGCAPAAGEGCASGGAGGCAAGRYTQ